MAKILGFINGILRGKLGGQVFSANASGEYVRQYVKPVNPNTQAQSIARSGFSTSLSAWHSLSAGQKQAWAVLATQIGLDSGINAFMSLRSRAIASERLAIGSLSPVPGDETVTDTVYSAPLDAPSVIAPPFTATIAPGSVNLGRDIGGNFELTINVAVEGGGDLPVGTFEPGFGITAYISNVVAQESHFLANPQIIKFGASLPLADISPGTTASQALQAVFTLNSDNYKSLQGLVTGSNYARITVFWESANGFAWRIGSDLVSVPPPTP